MSNIFNLFGSKPSSDVAGKKPYKAFTTVNSDRRETLGFMIYHEDGLLIEQVNYRYIIRLASTSPGELRIYLTDCVYHVTGNDVRPLIMPLRDNTINSLHGFNPDAHLPLPDDNKEMVIYSIIGQGNAEFWEEMEKHYEENKDTRI